MNNLKASILFTEGQKAVLTPVAMGFHFQSPTAAFVCGTSRTSIQLIKFWSCDREVLAIRTCTNMAAITHMPAFSSKSVIKAVIKLTRYWTLSFHFYSFVISPTLVAFAFTRIHSFLQSAKILRFFKLKLQKIYPGDWGWARMGISSLPCCPATLKIYLWGFATPLH